MPTEKEKEPSVSGKRTISLKGESTNPQHREETQFAERKGVSEHRGDGTSFKKEDEKRKGEGI